MKKSVLLKMFSLLLCCCMVFQAFAATGWMADGQTGIISEDLQAAMDAAGDDDLIRVYFWYPDISHEELEELVEAEIGFAKGEITAKAEKDAAKEYNDLMDQAEALRKAGAPEEEINACIEAANNVSYPAKEMEYTNIYLAAIRNAEKNRYQLASAAIIDSLGIDKEQISFNSRYAPLMVLRLTKAEIEAYAAENICSFSLCEDIDLKNATSANTLFGNTDGNMLLKANFDAFRHVWGFTLQNPKYVSGAGTIISNTGTFDTPHKERHSFEVPVSYDLIENDYFKAHKDELLLKAYHEFEENYETWKEINYSGDDYPNISVLCILANQKVCSADGVFKAFWEDYTNPEKTVYLEIMLTDVAAAADVLADEAVTLIYDTEACPCIVVRFTGSEETFRNIIDNPDVRFVAPALGAAIDPGYAYREMRTPYHSLAGGITAASARAILRYAVGMNVTNDLAPDEDGYVADEKEFFTFSDLDFDGHVTAADARLALRIAVGLDEQPMINVDI